jgi:FixJ family two-component response regulator
VANYNKTPAKSPGYQAALSMAGFSGLTHQVASTSKLKVTPGFMKKLTSIQTKIVGIVDDNPGMRKAIRRILSEFGYTTHAFDSAEAFLKAAATSKADCLVVDIQLGDISGVELVRQLTESGFTFPIIFMTALDDETIRNQATQLGCVDYLRKPFSADRLMEAIVKATS